MRFIGSQVLCFVDKFWRLLFLLSVTIWGGQLWVGILNPITAFYILNQFSLEVISYYNIFAITSPSKPRIWLLSLRLGSYLMIRLE